MPDKNERKVVFRFGFARNRSHRIMQLFSRGIGARQRRDMKRRSFRLEDPIELIRCRREALLIIGLAADAAHDHEPRGRARLKS